MLSSLKKQGVLFCYALSFFSRLPVPKSINFKTFPFHLGNAYFPVVGLLYALTCFVVYYASQFVFDNTISVILMLVAGMLFTGCLHEDGFADSCDGFGGGYNKKQCLAIMKDSQIGTYGVLGLIILLALKINVLSTLADNQHITFVGMLISAAIVSRFSVLCLMQYSEYARDDQSSKSITSSQHLPMKYFIAALLFSLLAMSWIPLIWCLLIITVVIVSTLLCRAYFYKQIAGYTGDCLGFLQQLNELLILLILILFLK